MKRRTFVKSTLAGAGIILFGDQILFGKSATHHRFDDQVVLGKTGLISSRVGLGTGMSGGNRESNHTRMGRKKLEKLIQYAFDKGVRFIDCADIYGTHPYILPALKEIPRDQYLINSKIWFRRGGIPEKERPDADVVVERFLKELGTDYLDIVQIHCVTREDWDDRYETQMEIMDKLKERGLIRAHGVSCHSLQALKEAAENPWVDVIHARINAYGNHMDASPDAVLPVLKTAHANGKGVVGMKLIGQGDFRYEPEKKQKSIEFALNSGAVDSMIVGFEKPEEVDDFEGMVSRVKRVQK